MPPLRPGIAEKSKVCALFVGDIHWSLQPPVARSIEHDWIAVQHKHWIQLKDLQIKYKAPIFIAGDLFDRWNSSVHLVNHVLSWISGMDVYTIPGNHDTPNHNYRELPRSAYWTLVEAGMVKHLYPGGTHGIHNMTISPFPFGVPVTPCNRGNGLSLEVALIHGYIWTKQTGYTGAADGSKLLPWLKKLEGYDVAVFGDNHKGFLFVPKRGSDFETTVFNCGSFMCRHSDEKDYKPCVGMLHTDGSMTRHYLDVSNDKFLDPGDIVSKLEKGLEIDLTEFAEELSAMHAEKLEFAKIVLRWLEKNPVPGSVKTIIMRAIGGNNAKDCR